MTETVLGRNDKEVQLLPETLARALIESSVEWMEKERL